MKRLACITAVLLSALLLCSALQSCQSCRSVKKLLTYSQDIKNIAKKNKQLMHLPFLGIPIAGNVSSYADTLWALGFEEYHRDVDFRNVDHVYLSGNYQNQEVYVEVIGTPRSRLVRRVALSFPDRTSWAEVESEYFRVKDSLTTLYGPPDSEELFEPPFKKGDGYEMKAIEKEMCTYQSDYFIYYGAATLGCIILSIDPGDEDNTAQVYLLYIDSHNDEIYDIETGQKAPDTLEYPTDSTDTTNTTTPTKTADSTSQQP